MTASKKYAFKLDGICKMASQAVSGQLGCQIWVDCAKHVGQTQTGEPIFWNSKAFTLLRSEPRILIVGAQAGSQRFAIVSAHACTSVSSEEAQQQFWDSLSKALCAVPRGRIPLLLCDANARFEHGTDEPQDNCYNAVCLQALLHRRDLCMSGNIDQNGRRIVSWIHPGPPQNQACVDYVAVPRDWGLGLRVV